MSKFTPFATWKGGPGLSVGGFGCEFCSLLYVLMSAFAVCESRISKSGLHLTESVFCGISNCNRLSLIFSESDGTRLRLGHTIGGFLYILVLRGPTSIPAPSRSTSSWTKNDSVNGFFRLR